MLQLRVRRSTCESWLVWFSIGVILAAAIGVTGAPGVAAAASGQQETRGPGPDGPEAYPVDTIHLVVPWRAGGGVDTLARGVAKFLPRYLKVSVVVDNWDGASSRVGSSRFQTIKPDGAYLMFNVQPDGILGQVLFQGQYDVRTWVPLFAFSSDRPFLAVRADGPYQSLEDLIRAMKSKRVLYANSGTGDSFHLQSAILRRALGVNFVLVPHRGTAGAFNALLGGNADFTIGNVQNYFQYANVRALALFGSGSDRRLPNVKSFQDLGYEVDPVITTRGVWGPPRLPVQLKEQLERVFGRVAEDPEFQAWAEQAGFVLEPLNSRQWEDRINQLFELATRYEPVLRQELE